MTLFEEIVKEALGSEITTKANEADVNPTDAQKKAGNYKMGHVRINGFAITVENPKGSYRCGKDKDGKEWKIKMTAHYGYFTKTVGKDGDAIDVFIGEHPESNKIYIVDQVDEKGNFDESKVMFCYRNKKEAKNGYLSNYSKDWKGFKAITGVDKDVFKKWLYDGHKQRKPFSEYAGIQTIKENAKDSYSEVVIPVEDTNRVMARLDESKDKARKRFNDITLFKQIVNEAFPSSPEKEKPYTIDPEKVLVVKKFLDNGFEKSSIFQPNDSGLPGKVNIVVMKNPDGSAAKNMYMEQLEDLLVDHFQNMFLDHTERQKFLHQVMTDWYNNKIGLFGSLSVNCLK